MACGVNCKSCSSTTSCNSCQDGFVATPPTGSCLDTSCPVSTYMNPATRFCQGCDSGCKSCTSSLCLTCTSGKFQNGAGSTCTLNACPTQTFADSNNFCQACGPNCKSCTNANTCSVCLDTFQMAAVDTPVCTSAACVTGKYREAATGICKSCGSNCKSCKTLGVCDVCHDNSVQETTPGQDCTVGSCSTGKVRNTCTGFCEACAFGCKSCNASTCLACASGSYQSGAGLTCPLTACPEKTFADSNNFCQSCGSNCKSCSDANTCTVCLSTFQMADTNSRVCTSTACVAGKYRDSATGVCQSCGTNCQLCSSADACDQCSENFFIATAGPNCDLTACPVNTSATLSGYCSACDAGCLLCSQDRTCTQCIPGYSQLEAGSTCDNTIVCSSSQKFRNAAGLCVSCGTGCQSCSDLNSCSICQATYQQETTPSSSCSQTSCSSSKYRDPVTGHCLSCGLNCNSCSASNGSACDSCNSGAYIDGTSTVCIVGSCPVGKFSDATGHCQNCEVSCKVCTSLTQCSVCATNYFQQPNQSTCTLTPCPGQYFPTPSTNVCASCDANCLTCSDPVVCLVCMTDYQMADEAASVCTAAACVMGRYRNAAGVCMPCGGNCKSCAVLEVCDNCSDNFAQSTTPSPDCPLTACPAHTYKQSSTGFCKPCGNGCDSCSETACLVCSSGQYQNGQGVNCPLTACPDTTFPDTATNFCKPCGSNCKTCVSSKACSVCMPTYQMPDSATKTCLITACVAGKYRDVNGVCQTCGLNCASCDTLEVCTKCTNGFAQDGQGSTCPLANCPASKYRAAATGFCQPCNSSCTLCTEQSCSACAPTFFQQPEASTCTSDLCPARFFPAVTTNVCSQCGANCLTCVNATSCAVCDNAFYQESPSTSRDCSSIQCSLGKYPESGTGHCLLCGSNCSACQNALSCDQCAPTFQQQQPNDPHCSATPCSDGTYRDSTGHCQLCAANCSICGENQICKVCDSTSVRIDNAAKACTPNASCDTGKYRDNTGLCVKCGSRCSQCQSGASCDLCELNYQQQDLSIGSCSITPCFDGTYRLTTGHCTSCGQNCGKCTNANVCIQCKSK